MKSYAKVNSNNSSTNNKTTNGFLPNSLKFISSCIKTASSGVRSASASVAASISGDAPDHKDQVLWAGFDRLELGPSFFKRVLLVGYTNGFQVLDVEDAPSVSELVSRRDDPVTFLQMQPLPAKSDVKEGFGESHPILLVVACDEAQNSGLMQSGTNGLVRDGYPNGHSDNTILSPMAVRFYSLKTRNYVHVLRFRSTVYMIRCSPEIVAVGLASQIYCFDALTLESKFSVLTYPVPQLGGQGTSGVNIGYGPMAVGPRWLAYASNNPLQSNTGRLSPQSLTPPGVSPSTSPSSGSLVARYAMESSKHLAAGLINLGDMGYKTLSKYYQEFVPDGSNSPLSSNSSRKVGRLALHSTETDAAGMVVLKDFISKAVISQFKAHSSPISALCFDPSGTLLVTASTHGSNINIFRIMPSCIQNGSGTQSYDWSSSHVHLYKLHRGMTSAVIQDICFSHYSQWIAIVSSRGTCHIFALSPFGGETVLQMHNSFVDGPNLIPASCVPWWSTSSFITNQQSFSPPPPPPVTLSVVSRIKNCNSGWLNTVSMVTASSSGKVSIPSGAISAVFHSCIPKNPQSSQLSSNTLEHLLVYTPSGHLIQHKLLPSMGGECGETVLRSPNATMQMKDEELRVRVEPIQWWDVCRRAAWPEREECISSVILRRKETVEPVEDTSYLQENHPENQELVKPHDRSLLYLSNSEVQINSGRIPVWQKSMVHFYTMGFPGSNEESSMKDNMNGEIEIEKVPIHEVEIKRKDLLPVFDHFRGIQSDWLDRSHAGAKSSSPSLDSHSDGIKYSEGDIGSDLKLDSRGLEENSDGISNPPIAKSVGDIKMKEKDGSVLASPVMKENSFQERASVSSKQSSTGLSPGEGSNFTNSPSTATSCSLSTDRTILKAVQSSKCGGASEGSNASSNRSDLSMNILDEGPMGDSFDYEPFFQEEYCKATGLSNCRDPAEALTDDVDSSGSPHYREKCEEDGDTDDMLGGVFAFSEEG
ncbi:autophagy-related protein 18h-like isoform X2 [Cucurbita moschata]|uniref:Autophagy-related protein 18h-like isoform X2 n=1 Tax=Cucurbita moschata TaxID=3662 RepID=A0A6J1EUJ9_CUCMO|nr:autophagy-related protein 18h-like isoform X2 [Cucurbita moschata]